MSETGVQQSVRYLGALLCRTNQFDIDVGETDSTLRISPIFTKIYELLD